jgi:hypothetical protein
MFTSQQTKARIAALEARVALLETPPAINKRAEPTALADDLDPWTFEVIMYAKNVASGILTKESVTDLNRALMDYFQRAWPEVWREAMEPEDEDFESVEWDVCVRALVFAARRACYEDPSPEIRRALDQALEEFVTVVPFDDGPDTPPPPPPPPPEDVQRLVHAARWIADADGQFSSSEVDDLRDALAPFTASLAWPEVIARGTGADEAGPWQWYASTDGNRYTLGPCQNRAEIIKEIEMRADSFTYPDPSDRTRMRVRAYLVQFNPGGDSRGHAMLDAPMSDQGIIDLKIPVKPDPRPKPKRT